MVYQYFLLPDAFSLKSVVYVWLCFKHGNRTTDECCCHKSNHPSDLKVLLGSFIM